MNIGSLGLYEPQGGCNVKRNLTEAARYRVRPKSVFSARRCCRHAVERCAAETSEKRYHNISPITNQPASYWRPRPR